MLPPGKMEVDRRPLRMAFTTIDVSREDAGRVKDVFAPEERR